MKSDIVVRNDNVKNSRLITVFLASFHLIYFCYLYFSDRNTIACAIVMLLAAYGTYCFIISKTKKERAYIDWMFYPVAAICWILIKNYWFAGICVLLALFSFHSEEKIIFSFSSEGIRKKHFPFSLYTWSQLDNVILKDNILTIDFKDNKIIQAEIEPDNSIGELEFNAFAQSMLSKTSNI